MLTRTSHFTPNKSGIGISVLCNRCFISITSQFGWAGGGKGIGTIFQKITLSNEELKGRTIQLHFWKKMSYDVFLIGEFNLNILVKTAWRYSNSKYFFSNFDVTLVAYFSSLSLLTKMKKTQKCSKWAWNHTNLLKIL